MPYPATAPKAAPPATFSRSRHDTRFLSRAVKLLRLSRLSGKARALAQPVTYIGIALLVFVYGGLAYLIFIDRKHAEEDAGVRGGNLARVVDQSFSHIFKSVDNSLLFLRKLYRQPAGPADLSAWMREPALRSVLMFDFLICDANGRVIDSSFSREIVGTDRSGQESFRAQVNSITDEMQIGRASILESTGKWAIPLSRRLVAADGSFAGVIVALLDPSRLIQDVGKIDLGADGSVALVGLDGYLRTRSVDSNIDWANIGRKVGMTPETLGRALRASTGRYWSVPGVFNDVRRLVSYRVLNDYRQIALVTIPEADVFRRANDSARIYWFAATTTTIVILIVIGFGVRREEKLIEATTAMLQTKEALRRGKERYKLVEAAVNDGIWDWNLLTDEDYLSPRWKSILGYAEDEVPNVPSSFFDRVHPDDKPTVAEALRAHFEEHKRYDLNFRLRHKDGDYRWVRSRGKAIRDAENSAVRMLGTITDITEQKRAEALMQETNANLARAEAMILLGHFKYVIASDTYIWSEGVYRLTGKSRDTFKPSLDAALELIHPDDRYLLVKGRADALAGLEPPPVTARLIKDDNSLVFLEIWLAPLRDSSGVVTGMFGTIQDITERRRTEALMNESYSNLKRAEAMAQLGHYKYDNASETLTWSEGIYRIFELSPASFTPTLSSALLLYQPDDRPKLEKYRDDLLAGLEPPPLTIRATRTDGRAKEIELWSAPVRAADGRVTGMFGTIQDVTVRKRAEETLARANQELEARVTERTAELAREMRRREEAQMTLGQMQKMEAVGQLTAGIAHDFNNLLAVIGGSLEFVDRSAARGLTAEPELIDAALRATRRGRELVRRLLAFSRQTPLRAEPAAIDQLVLDTLRLLQRTLGQGIDMVTRLDAKAAVISVDRNQMANALLNLALNARDAMPDGGQLTIATACQPIDGARASLSATGEEVCITISDSGVGMTDEVRNRAFEPFFSTKPDGLGSGLGLSMVQGFVEQSGGRIEIQSALGNGTAITIRLPRIASEGRADEADTIAAVPASGREKTVLLVEDDPDVRVVTTAQLRHLGYKVHAVGTGMEAIDLIASPATIDITLTDIVLPGGFDGVALVKEAMRARPTMGVLCMSGYNPAEKHRKWLKVQNINFLEKPFSSVRLAQALDAALAH